MDLRVAGGRDGSRAAFWALACLVAALAVGTRVETLERRPLWFDERWTEKVVREAPDLRSLWRVGEADHFQHPPLAYAAAWLAARGEPTPGRLRAPSLLAGLASIAALGWLGASLFGRTAGLLAALLATVSVYHIDSSQDARPYMLSVLFTTALYGSLIAFLRRRRRAWLVAFAVAASGALYTYHLGLVHLAVAAGALLLHGVALTRSGQARSARDDAIAIGATLACVALVYSPQLLNLRGFASAPGLEPNHRLAVTPAFLHALFQRWGGGFAWTAWAYAAAVAIGAWRLARRRDLAALAVAGWGVAPFAVFALIPFSKYFEIRFLISALPVFFLLAGAGLDGAARAAGAHGRAARALATVLLVALFLVPAGQVYAVFRQSAERCGDAVHRPEILEADGRFCAEHLVLGSIFAEQQWILRSLGPSIELAAAQLEEYVGSYRFASGPRLAITRRGEHLFIEVDQQLAQELVPAAENRFHFRVLPGRSVVFQRDAGGRVIALDLDRRGERARALRE